MKNCARYAGKSRYRSNRVAMWFRGILIKCQKQSSSNEWFKDAIFYEVYVRGFYDSDGDGVGDFRGLTAKLDYLEWLGIDCIW